MQAVSPTPEISVIQKNDRVRIVRLMVYQVNQHRVDTAATQGAKVGQSRALQSILSPLILTNATLTDSKNFIQLLQELKFNVQHTSVL